ncbi:unnamed protein product [Rotaria sp. Silwood1]|nr:unnamed protein product [Rotaria sp. Silwood1]CAF1661995.1 unnamed protein product [Rotaria sp. Silwood1]CAF3766153.1 unnamed protein product [Rotaria sp. Silwood1]CAF3873310.1 unnamed protein product [Rotaria sp. Silwood1]CAF3912821.1 unnamed protein product [Rotaria sp. Silwood1]
MHEPISTPLVDDEDDELTAEDLPYLSSIFNESEQDLFQYNTQQPVDYFAFPLVEENIPSEKPILNEDIFDLLVRIHRLVQKARTFVTMTRLVGALQRYVHQRIDPKKGAFILDSKVRWNSTFKMLDRIINHRNLVDEIFTKRDINGLTTAQKVKLRSLVFTYDDWELLNALRDCLLPFEKVTTILSGDYTTQALSYYALQVLKENFYQTSDPSYYHAIINKSLSCQYEYYLDEFLPSDQKIIMKVAAFLDPLFHGDLMLNKKDYETAKCVVMEDMQRISLTASDISASPSSSTSSILSTTTASNRMVEFKSSLMAIAKKKTSIPLSFQPITPDLEMAAFLNLVRDNELMNFQLFWKTNCRALPRLSQLVRRYNVVPATSVYLEQTFSVAGAIKNLRRASMSSLSLRSLMILKKKNNIEKIRSFSQ